MIRREFLRLTSLAAGAFPFVKHLEALSTSGLVEDDLKIQGVQRLSSTQLQELFLNPPARFRPMVRWWWNGDRVVPEEILRELDVLQKAGIGGVEINPIKFPDEADPMKTKALIWMSDEWISALEVALKGTKERGMTCDMIVGSGWPYGGEFLSREDQTQMMALGTRDLAGPQRVRIEVSELLADVSPRFVSPYKDPLKELGTAMLVPYELADVRSAVPIRIDRNEGAISFDVPAGRYVLYFLVKLTGFMAVINGAPGASGPVLNHYSGASVSKYLDRISERLTSKIGPLGQYFRAFFTDSIELEGANWCDDMLAEFERRRGYDLAPFLPFVLFKVGEMGNAIGQPYGAMFSDDLKEQTKLVRYDFETTKQELFQERFVATFVAWCRKNGVKSRMQAYGMDCDPISAGMMVDIPECETWIRTEKIEAFGDGDYDHGRNYTMINKFVSSAAHLSGKQLISCEEMTNTDDPFHASLERIKVAGDQSVLSGVTQSVLHGFNYSPLDIPFPGWVRYGTYFSERNSWWPYFKLWVDYKARLSALFQHAEMQADIAILPPRADLAANYGFQRDPFPRIAYPGYLYKLWEVIHQNGSGCDYLTEEIIGKSGVANGRITFQGRSYKAILLAKVETLRLETAQKLLGFVGSGGTVVFLDAIPRQSAGLEHHVDESAQVSEVISTMRKRYPIRTPLEPVRETDMVGWYRALQQRHGLEPDVYISTPTDYLSQIHYRNAEQDIFFFTHYGPQQRLTFKAQFKTGEKAAWLWDAESGTRYRIAAPDASHQLTISLGPSESKLIVFEAPSVGTVPGKKTGQLLDDRPPAQSKRIAIAGPWHVQLAHVDGTNRTIILQELVDLDGRDDLRSFAGTITYRKEITIDGARIRRWIDLGLAHAISSLEINGKPMGVRWYGDHLYDVSGALVPGLNNVSIKLVTTLGDYMKTLTDNPTARAWTTNTPRYPLGLKGPIDLVSA